MIDLRGGVLKIFLIYKRYERRGEGRLKIIIKKLRGVLCERIPSLL